MKVEIIKKKEKQKPKVKIGDIVCWTIDPYKEMPCLVSYKVLVCLTEPEHTWDFDCISQDGFIREIEKLIDKGEMRKMDEIEKIVIYPKEEE